MGEDIYSDDSMLSEREREILQRMRARDAENDARRDTDRVRRAIEALSTALAKLPPYRGVVYRGGSFAPEVVDRYLPGDVLVEDAFTSASVHGGAGGNVLFEILSTWGKEVGAFAADPSEGEVVFERGTAFLVLAVERIGDRTHVLLADLAEPASPFDADAALATLRSHRPEATAPGAPPGLAPGKGYFPIGVRVDGSANVVAHRG